MTMTFKKLRFISNLSLIALLLVIFTTCQKDVDSIILESGFSVTSSVYNSSTNAVIAGAEVLIDGNSKLETDANGKFILADLESGEYQIQIRKEGFTSGFYNLVIENCQGVLPVFYLKELSPPTEIDKSGGLVKAYYSTGKLAAELEIPESTFPGKKKFYSSVLFGNEAPAPITSTEKIQGTVVNFQSEDISFTTRNAKIRFVLPYMLQAGDSVPILYFKETEQVWDTLKYAQVDSDNLTVEVEVDSLNLYSIALEGKYSEIAREKVSCDVVGTSSDYQSSYSWNSYLTYSNRIPGADETSTKEIKIFLNQLIEMYSRIGFSKINYVGLPQENFPKNMIANIGNPPLGNPPEYANLPARPWELVKHCCVVTNDVMLKIFDPSKNTYVDHVIRSKYLSCNFDWVWRANDTYDYCSYMSCSEGRVIVPALEQHSGGSGK